MAMDIWGGQLCPFAHMCDAMCGYCQMPAVSALALGQTAEVVVHAAYSQILANTPTYHTFDMVAGQTYRIRAWSELKAIVLILVDPTGYPIRRSMSQGGRALDETPGYKSYSEVNEQLQDTEGLCRGDRNVEVIYKATETATYKVGVGHMIGAFGYSRPAVQRTKFTAFLLIDARHPSDFGVIVRPRRTLPGDAVFVGDF
eukprot:SAG11_NODE_12221_length_715_cov_0.457792_1_plen_199_part_10